MTKNEWIKVENALPENHKAKQVWGILPNISGHGTYYGCYIAERQAWISIASGYEISNVTHWAEMLGKPEVE